MRGYVRKRRKENYVFCININMDEFIIAYVEEKLLFLSDTKRVTIPYLLICIWVSGYSMRYK